MPTLALYSIYASVGTSKNVGLLHGLASQAHPTPQHLFTDTDLGRHVRYRPARLDHQAGNLLPDLRSVLPTLA